MDEPPVLLLVTSFRSNLWPSFSGYLLKFLRIDVLQLRNYVGQAYLPVFLVLFLVEPFRNYMYVLHHVRAYLCFLLVLSLVSPAGTLSCFGKHVVRAYLCACPSRPVHWLALLSKPSGPLSFFGKQVVLAYLCARLVLFFVQPFRNDVLWLWVNMMLLLTFVSFSSCSLFGISRMMSFSWINIMF